MRRLGAVRKFHARGHQYHILTRSGHGQFIIAVVGVGTSPPNSAIKAKRGSGLVSAWLDHRSLKHSPSDKRERDAPLVCMPMSSMDGSPARPGMLYMSNCVALKRDFDLAARRYIGGECNDRPA